MTKQIWKKLGICVLSLSLVSSSGIGLQLIHADAEEGSAVETKTGEIFLDGNDIKADNVNGLTYKGFGMLTGNSTSDLLMDYKAQSPESYAQLMQYLFGGEYPIFTHIKLEMGNDRNNSTGSESATMRTKDEKPNVRRNPGWQLAADAKKINPDLKVSILSWNTPTWVSTDEDKYFWYKQSILAGYEEFGFMVDYINPNKNEVWSGTRDVTRTKQFAEWIAAENEQTIADPDALKLYQKIKLVVSDEANVVSEEVAETMEEDPEFMEAVDVVGYHYKTWDDANDAMKWLAEEQDKEIWNSEEQATFSNSAFRPSNNIADPTVVGTGLGGSGSALEMGNTVIKSFVESRRGHVIYQPVIGSFYEGGQYSFKELVSARDPWSGWIHYDAGLLVLAHISKFAVTGWENEDNTAGIWRGVASASKADAYQEDGYGSNAVDGRIGGENYLTLAAPTKDAFSTVIVNDSEYPMTYTLQTENMDLPEDQTLELWETRAADDGAFNENYMKCLGDVSKNADGKYQFAVKPYSTVTVTSLDVSDSEEHTQGLPVEGERTVLDTDATGSVQNTEDGYLYADNFEYENCTMPIIDGQGGLTEATEDYIASRGGDDGAMARYTHTLNGAFEVYKDSTENYVLRQQTDEETTGIGSAWNKGDPVTLIGDFRWTNYTASVDVLFEHSAEGQYAQIGIRQTGSSHILEASSGYTFRVGEDGEWQLYRRNSATGPIELATGKLGSAATKPGTWFKLKLRGEGNYIKAYVNEELVASYQDAAPITSGRVGLGCSSTNTCFDNLEVTKVKGYDPYYTEYIDNMETYDLTSEKNAKLQYNDKWSITCADQGMYVYQRSMSYSTEVGAALTYTFRGTGLEILGNNQAVMNAGKENEVSNQVHITVDGERIKSNDTIWTTGYMCTTYRVDGLPYGEHTITVEVAQGSLAVDAVAILGESYQGLDLGEVLPPQNTNQQPNVSPTSPASTTAPGTQSVSLKKGIIYQVGGASYKVTNVSAKTVTYRAPKKTGAKSITVPATVKIKTGSNTVTCKVTAISAKAFTKCKKLTKVTIGKNVESIDKGAFKNCKSLKTIAIKSTKLKKVGNNAIQGIHKKAVITCGKKKVKAYQKLFSKKTGYKKTMKVR